MIDRLQTRLQDRAEATQRGFITMQVLALTVLLLVAAGGLVAVAQATVNTSRESRDFTDARRGSDAVESDVIKMLQNPATPPLVTDGTYDYTKSGSGTTGRSTWSWTSATNRTITIKTTVKGVGGDATTSTETTTLPFRGTYVASRDSVASPTGSGTTYGIPAGPRAPSTSPLPSSAAMGLWANAVSTAAGASTIVGSTDYRWTGKKATWAMFGGSVSNAAQSRVVAYADGISAPAGSTTFSRSQLNAYMDTRISDQLMSNVRSNEDCQSWRNLIFWTKFNNSFPSYGCWKGDVDYDNVNGTPSGVSTHVVKGDLIFGGDFQTGSSGEAHIYVDGDVIFGKPETQRRIALNKVYIYAPNGTCRATAGTRLHLIGSLACKTVVLNQGTDNYVGWERPREQGNAEPYTLSTSDPGGNYRAVDSPKVIHYFERPGFVDQWSS